MALVQSTEQLRYIFKALQDFIEIELGHDGSGMQNGRILMS